MVGLNQAPDFSFPQFPGPGEWAPLSGLENSLSFSPLSLIPSPGFPWDASAIG
jgi:hypothetical protein